MELSCGLKIREVSSIVISATAALNQDNTRRHTSSYWSRSAWSGSQTSSTLCEMDME